MAPLCINQEHGILHLADTLGFNLIFCYAILLCYSPNVQLILLSFKTDVNMLIRSDD